MSALGETLRALRARGFTPVAAKLPVRAFKGGWRVKRRRVSQTHNQRLGFPELSRDLHI